MLVMEAERFGGPQVLTARQVPDPVAGPGRVVVRTSAADVLFVDTFIRAGRAVDFFPIRPPYVPGNGVAGQVISLGDGVDPGWAGRPVVAHTGGSGGSGGYAEQVAVAAGELIPVPDELGLPAAAALLHDGSTAMGLLLETGVKPGEQVLVTAAAGGMGVLLVQLARAAGGRVIGAARGRRKLAVSGTPAPTRSSTTPSPAGPPRFASSPRATGPTWCSTARAARWAGPPSRSSPLAAGSPRTACPAAGSRRWTRPRHATAA